MTITTEFAIVTVEIAIVTVSIIVIKVTLQDKDQLTVAIIITITATFEVMHAGVKYSGWLVIKQVNYFTGSIKVNQDLELLNQ